MKVKSKFSLFRNNYQLLVTRDFDFQDHTGTHSGEDPVPSVVRIPTFVPTDHI